MGDFMIRNAAIFPTCSDKLQEARLISALSAAIDPRELSQVHLVQGPKKKKRFKRTRGLKEKKKDANVHERRASSLFDHEARKPDNNVCSTNEKVTFAQPTRKLIHMIRTWHSIPSFRITFFTGATTNHVS